MKHIHLPGLQAKIPCLPGKKFTGKLLLTLTLLISPAVQAAETTPAPGEPVWEARHLARLIWEHNPEVQQARLGLVQDQANLLKNSQWQNPTFQAGVGSIPLSRMMLSSPNYKNPPLDPLVGPNLSVNLTQPVEFGKREIRIQRYQHALQVSLQNLRLLYQQRVADLDEILIRVAISRLRQQLLQEQINGLKTLLENLRLSVAKGFAAPLDAERIELEQGHLQVDMDAEQIIQANLRSQWARLTLREAPVLSLEQAEEVVHSWCQAPASWPQKILLPQQAVLQAQEAQAQSDLELAHRMPWPDPSFQVGYTYDSLTTGNVVHTFGTSVSMTLPVWQAGQAEAMAAEGQMRQLALQRQSLLHSLSYQEPALRQQIQTLSRNLTDLQSHRLVLARATLDRYSQALEAHGITLYELIQTRRTVLDLEGQRLDLLQELGLALVDYRRLTTWNIPEPEGVTP